MFGLGPLELMVIGILAVMLYGKQLPDVGLKVGKSLSELRRQWSTISRDLDVTGEIKKRPRTDARWFAETFEPI